MIRARGAPIFQRISLAESIDRPSPVAMRVLEKTFRAAPGSAAAVSPGFRPLVGSCMSPPGPAAAGSRSADRWQPAVRTFEQRIVRWLDPVDSRNPIKDGRCLFLGRRSADQRSPGTDWTKAGEKAKYGFELFEELFSWRHDFFIRGERHIISVHSCRGRLTVFEKLLPALRWF